MMELATGRFPYPEEVIGTHFDLLPYIVDEPSPSLPSEFSEEFRTFIDLCLLKDHNNRPGAASLLVMLM
jgi:serine/threonine protein kinase